MAEYDYNKIQPGSSDIDREAWPVMYDPENNEYLQTVNTKDSESIKFEGKGSSLSPLTATVTSSALDGKVKIITGEGTQEARLTGDGTEGNPLNVELEIPADYITGVEDTETVTLSVSSGILSATAIPSAFDGKIKVSTSNEGNVVLEGDGTDENPLSASVEIPEDYIQAVSNSDSISISVVDSVLSASAIPSALNGEVEIEVDNTDTNVTLWGKGTTESPLKASAEIQENFIESTSDTDTVTLSVVDRDLSASVIASALDGKVGISTSNSGNVVLNGNGTEGNPLSASVDIPEDFIKSVSNTDSLSLSVSSATGELSGEVRIDSNNPGNVSLSVTNDGLKGSVEIPEDYIQGVSNSSTVVLAVTEGVLGASAVPGGLDGKVGIKTADTGSVAFSGDGTDGNPLTASAMVPEDFIKAVDDTSSIDLTVDANGKLTGDLKLSQTQGNVVLSVESDGLKAEAQIPPDYIHSVQSSDSIAISVVDSVLSASAIPSALNGEVEIVTGNQGNVVLSGKGTTADPLTASAVIPAGFIESVSDTDSIDLTVDANGDLTAALKLDTVDPGNVSLSVTSDGLKGEVVIPSPSVVDSSTIDLSVDANGAISASAVISSETGNQLSDNNGLFVPEPESLYLGAFPATARPSDAETGQYILDTDLGYMIFKDGNAWINAAGGVEEGVLTPPPGTPEYVQNPMTTAGDLIVAGSDGYPNRLAIGTNGQVLTMSNGMPAWSTPSGGGGGGSDWREVLPATNRYYQVSSQASGLVRRFYPLGTSVRSVMVMTASYKVGATCSGHIRIYKMQIPNGSTESAEATATLTSIAHKAFSLTVKSGVIWVPFDADVDVSDASYQYYYAIGFNNSGAPNPSDYLRFQLSAAVSTASTSSHTVEFHVATSKLIDSTTPNTLGYTAADYTYVSGISSKVES